LFKKIPRLGTFCTQEIDEGLKKHAAGQKFHEGEEAKNEVTTWLSAQTAEVCDVRIKMKLVPRLNKFLDKGGDYVEKWLNVGVKFFYPIS
jgi:hypothetical protein